jgi:hypothetical protein
MQSPLSSKMREKVPALIADVKRTDLLLFLVIFVTVLSVTPLLIWGGVSMGFSYILGALAALVVAALVVKWPLAGLYVVAGCVVLVEREPLPTGPIITDQLYVYYWPPNFTELIERPIGFLLLFILLVLVSHRLAKRQRVLWGGPLLLPFIGFLLAVAWGIVHGLQTGGDFKIIVLEVRPFWYLFMAYLLAYNLLLQKRHIRAFFWLIILGAGVKGLQGTYIYLIKLHGDLTNYHEIMEHEDSYFFVAVLLLLIIFCLHYRYRPQMYALLLILPTMLIALVANQRRADYLAFLVGLGIAWVLIFLIKPQARKQLAILGICTLLLATGYVFAFAHTSGAIGQPARAITSILNPSSANAADASSDLYRAIEDADLKYTVKQDPILGWGFGKQFLQPTPLPVLTSPDYQYVPHNTIYWVWMRLGAIGYTLMWYLFGAAIVRGCLIVRQLRDTYLQGVAIFIVAATVMEIIVSYADYQLFWYRNVLYTGLLLGMLMRLPALDEAAAEEKEPVARETLNSIRAVATPQRGGKRA